MKNKGFTLMSKALKGNPTGFTLIETLLYVAIVSIVLASLIPFAWNIIGGSVKSSSQQELSSQARSISERIKYEIRNSTGINSVTANSISLIKSEANLNPTLISLSGNNLQITQGASGAINLNSTDTKITSLAFTNYTSADNKTKHINFNFTLAEIYTGTRQEYQVPDITIESSAEIRSN